MLDGEYSTRLPPPWFLVHWMFSACYLDQSFSDSEDAPRGTLLRVLVLIQQVRAGTGGSAFPNMLSGGFDAPGAQTSLCTSRPTPRKAVASSPRWELIGALELGESQRLEYKVHIRFEDLIGKTG